MPYFVDSAIIYGDMVVTLIIAGVTVLLMALSVIFKPYLQIKKFHIGLYCLIALTGAIVILATGALPIKDAIHGITENSSVNPIKILALFLSMTLISVFLDDAGFFEYVANKIFKIAHGGGIKLFLIMYLSVAVLTVFTSNDIIVLTFTPPIILFARRAKISPVPYLIGEFIAANTWSMMLVVGNPTNVYIASGAGISFAEYFTVMAIPTLFGGLLSLGLLLLLFHRSLTKKTDKSLYTPMPEPTNKQIAIRKVPLIVSLCHLILCIVLLAVADFIKVEMWLICVISCGSLIVFSLFYGLFKDKSLSHLFTALSKAPYELIPFVLSMFIIVLALYKQGVTDIIANAILTGKETDALTTGFLSGISANLLNNIPMSVLFEKITAGQSLHAVYGAIIGSNLGAFITPIGALAGIMWNKILASHGEKLSFLRFTAYGTIIALPTILVACLGVMLVL